jgi:hypothetical protein
VTTIVEAPVEAVDVPETLDPRVLGVQIEAKLAEWHLEYQYGPKFPLQDIRVAPWAQVREEQHIADKDSLNEFVVQMKEGAVYPPIVLMDPNVLTDGNHRVNAAKTLRRRTLPAFVVKFPTVDMAKAFAAAMNQLNGRRLDNEEAFQIALTMFAMGLDDQAIAREVGRSQEAVRQMRRRKEFATRSTRLGLDETSAGIPEKQRIKLAQIDHDPVFAKAVEIAGSAKLPAKQINEIVKAADAATSDGEAIEALENLRGELAVAGPPPVRITIPQAVRQARLGLGSLLKYEQNPIEVLDLVDDQHRVESIDRWRRLREMANQVLIAYGEQ